MVLSHGRWNSLPRSGCRTSRPLYLKIEYGHRVRIATHANFKTFVRSAGVNFHPLGGDPRVLAGSFTIIVDHKMRCLLLFIRGTHSIKDTLTAVTGIVVPFHHTVVHRES